MSKIKFHTAQAVTKHAMNDKYYNKKHPLAT